jgi:23S rRNA (uracil1939-C5)-methyltransferase
MSDSIEITLETMANGGSALGRNAGRTVFIPYTIPGETVMAQVVAEKGRTLFAEGLTLLEASADRVFPRCEFFGPHKCGGCHWQHIAYGAQLLLKQDVLTDQLERIGGLPDAEVRPLIAAPAEWGYNEYMTFVRTADGRLGFPGARFAPGADVPAVAVNACHVLHPDLLELKDSLELEKVTGIEEATFIRTDDAPMLILRMADDLPPELETDLPMSINLLLSDGEAVNLIGDLHGQHTVGGRTFRVTAGSPFRANRGQLPALAEAVRTALELTGSEHLLELYAGVGFFSALLAPHTRRLTLVEDDSDAVDDADFNTSDFDHVDVIESAVEDVWEALDGAYDAALVDPPAEEGLSGAALDGLVALGLRRIVYVSGDPATLARDAKRLTAQGYRLVYAQPLDFAPQTFALETVARFDRLA